MATKKQVNDILKRCRGGRHKRNDKRSSRAYQKQQQIKQRE